MNTPAATASHPEIEPLSGRFAITRTTLGWMLGGIVGLGVALRFASLGTQSFHHDEVITAARVIPGSFFHMLKEVKVSESNPPLYYVLAWGWVKAFGIGEVGLRSLSAVFGAATVPVAYLIGRELASRRAGLIAAVLVAVNPMLIWYSQEARSYALLVFFGAVALLFFIRALRTQSGTDLALWALASALALCSHYFAAFAIAIEAAWLLIALPGARRAAIVAISAVGLTGLALAPLVLAQANPHHVGWIEHSPLSSRLFQTGVSFLIGETGHVIAEPPRVRFAEIPLALVVCGMILLALRGSRFDWRRFAPVATIGLGVIVLATATAFAGSDYVVERNLLPALVPLAVAVAIGFSVDRARVLGIGCATLLCAYWLVFDVYVAHTANLQRPDFRDLVAHLGKPTDRRAIVTWKLAADPIRYYLHDSSQRAYSGAVPIREIDVVSKPNGVGEPAPLPRGFQPVQKFRLERLTLTRYMSPRPRPVMFWKLNHIRTGFGANAVVTDGPGLR